MSDPTKEATDQLEILLVMEDRSEQEVLQGMLQSEGIKVHATDSCKSALEFMGSHNVDVVMSDITVDKVLGASLTSCIKATSPEVYVILLTQLSGYRLITDAIKAGADSFLSRPLHRGRIKALLRSIRSSKQYKDQLG